MAEFMPNANDVRCIIVEYWFRMIVKKVFIMDIMSDINKYSAEYEEFDQDNSDKCLQFNDDGTMVTRLKGDGLSGGWMIAFGSIIASPGSIYEWKIKITKYEKDWMIGIMENDEINNTAKNRFFFHHSHAISIYADKGTIYTDKWFNKSGYSTKYGVNDIVGIELDLINNSLQFSINGTKYTKITEFVKGNTNYRMLAACYNLDADTHQAQIIEYRRYE